MTGRGSPGLWAALAVALSVCGTTTGCIVVSGPRSSTGYELRVLSVRERGGRLVVTVHERTPALGERVTPRVTHPFLLLSVPRSEKSLLLKWPGRP